MTPFSGSPLMILTAFSIFAFSAPCASTCFKYGGMITHVDNPGADPRFSGLQIGSRFTGSYVFDPTAPDAMIGPELGVYETDTTAQNGYMRWQSGSVSVESVVRGALVITVARSIATGLARYSVNSYPNAVVGENHPSNHMGLWLEGPVGLFPTDALPASPPPVAQFPVSTVAWSYFGSSSIGTVGRIDSLTTCGCQVAPISREFFQAVDRTGSDVPWACDIYNHPYMWDSPSRYCAVTPALTRIAQKGCSLAVLTMSLSAAGVHFTDPSFLNSYMVTHPGDFTPGHDVNWDTTVRDLAITAAKPLEFVRFESTSAKELEDKLCIEGFPVVVGVNLRPSTTTRGLVPGHFVLVTGKSDNDFQIVDPGHPERTTLGAYQNTFETRGFVKDPPGDRSAVQLSVADAELLLTDPNGRLTGFDAVKLQDVKEIPQSSYTRDSLENDETGAPPTQISYLLGVRQPKPGTYTVAVHGVKSTRYSLALSVFSADGSRQPYLLVDGVADTGSKSVFEIQIDSSSNAAPHVLRVATFESTLADISHSLQLGLIENRGLANSLSQKIEAAVKASGPARANVLDAFKNEVRAQSEKQINAAAAQILIEDADSLLNQSR